MSYSDGGFSGSNNNVNVDPLFVSQATGDLHLTATSPCLNAGDLFTAFGVQKDYDENSRILDSALSGIPGADMGAYELGNWDMDVFGVPRIEHARSRSSSTVPPATRSTCSASSTASSRFRRAGILLAGAIPYVVGDRARARTTCRSTPRSRSSSRTTPSIIGLTAGIQTLTRPPGSPR